jgi:hypothetical protein
MWGICGNIIKTGRCGRRPARKTDYGTDGSRARSTTYRARSGVVEAAT